MMPITHLYTTNFTDSPQTSPDLRRMDMYHRARREEMDAMLFSMNPRQQVNVGHSIPSSNRIASVFGSVRNGIGQFLISAGSRIQSA